MESIGVDFNNLMRSLQAGRACGISTTASFRGVLYGEKVSLHDREREFDGIPAGLHVHNELRKMGCERNPARKAVTSRATITRLSNSQLLRDAVYIDMRRAYLQMLRRVGWDCEFSFIAPKRGSMLVTSIPGIEQKPVYTTVVGIAASTRHTVWKDGIPSYVPYKNSLYNPHLVRCIWAMLSAAWYAAQDAFVYFNSDGGICRASDAQHVIDTWGSLGLEARVKESWGRVLIAGGRYYDATESIPTNITYTRPARVIPAREQVLVGLKLLN